MGVFDLSIETPLVLVGDVAEDCKVIVPGDHLVGSEKWTALKQKILEAPADVLTSEQEFEHSFLAGTGLNCKMTVLNVGAMGASKISVDIFKRLRSSAKMRRVNFTFIMKDRSVSNQLLINKKQNA